MIWTLVLIIHLFVCFGLILFILLQTGKGADIGAAFGGGSSQTVFGSTGATTFLSKVTIAAAVIFMCTSFVLTYFAGRSATVVTDRSVMTEQGAGQQVPVSGEGVPAPEGTTSVPAKPSAPAPSEGKAPAGQPSGTAAPQAAPQATEGSPAPAAPAPPEAPAPAK